MELGFHRPGDVEKPTGTLRSANSGSRPVTSSKETDVPPCIPVPNFGSPRGDARLDMTDLYAFPKAKGSPTGPVLVLNVHPSFGCQPARPDDERALRARRIV